MAKQRTRKLDLAGRHFGSLIVLRFARADKLHAYWRCRCACGRELTLPRSDLVGGKRTACRRACRFPDMVGRTFGRWTVLGRVRRSEPGRWWRCRCACGTEAIKPTRQLGVRKSCGCIQRRPADEAGVSIVLRAYVASAKKRGLPFRLSLDGFRALIFGVCHYCGVAPGRVQRIGKRRELICNGIDRKNPLRGYTRQNVVTCCYACNRRKRTTPYAEFMMWIGRVWALHGPVSKRSL